MPRKKSVDSASEPGSQKPKKRAVRKKKTEQQAVTEEIVSIPPENPQALPQSETSAGADAAPQNPPAEEVDHFEIHPDAAAAIAALAAASEQHPAAQAPEASALPRAEAEHPQNHAEEQPKPAAENIEHGELLETGKIEQKDAKPQASMADIKPKAGNDFPAFAELNADRDFLAPEKFSFDLKPGVSKVPEQKTGSGWVRTLIYILIGIAVLSAGALIFLNYYSQKLLNPTASNTQPQAQTQSPAPAPAAPALTVPKLALVNANDPTSKILSVAVQANPTVVALDSQTVSLPAANADILYIKSTNADQAKKVSDLLSSIGIAPQIQQKSDLTDDYALYLTGQLSNVNLGGLTAAAYNSGSVTGLAGKYCAILKKYKVASCNALNSTAKQNIFTVATNSASAIVKLSRTPEFKNASFAPAASGQVEDIRVTASK